MSAQLFPDNINLDSGFLNDTYSDDPETAIMMFENYLQDLPSNMQLLQDSFNKKDILSFRQLIHKQKPGFSYVGLTDVTEMFHQLQTSCQEAGDLEKHKQTILNSFARIESATPVITQMLERLREQQ